MHFINFLFQYHTITIWACQMVSSCLISWKVKSSQTYKGCNCHCLILAISWYAFFNRQQCSRQWGERPQCTSHYNTMPPQKTSALKPQIMKMQNFTWFIYINIHFMLYVSVKPSSMPKEAHWSGTLLPKKIMASLNWPYHSWEKVWHSVAVG